MHDLYILTTYYYHVACVAFVVLPLVAKHYPTNLALTLLVSFAAGRLFGRLATLLPAFLPLTFLYAFDCLFTYPVVSSCSSASQFKVSVQLKIGFSSRGGGGGSFAPTVLTSLFTPGAL